MFPKGESREHHQEDEQSHRDEPRHHRSADPLAEIIELLAYRQPIRARVPVVSQEHYRRRRSRRRSSQSHRQLQTANNNVTKIAKPKVKNLMLCFVT